ncbi:MAG: TIM barrel protein [Pseudomonadota bacterium]
MAKAMAAPEQCLNLPKEKVAIQMFAVYEDITGVLPRPKPGEPWPLPTARPDQLADLFGRVRSQGWQQVENFANTWSLPQATYVELLSKSGLRAVASHDSLAAESWITALDRASALHQKFIGSGDFGKPGINSLEETLATAANLDRVGAEARARGLRFYVHTHQQEFRNKFSYDLRGNGVPELVSVFDIVAARAHPENVSFQIDVGWAHAAFGQQGQSDLLAMFRRYRDRITLLHIKDVDSNFKPTDLGAGVVDFKKILAAAGPQIEYFIWEYDHPPKPMESAALAYRFMTCGT